MKILKSITLRAIIILGLFIVSDASALPNKHRIMLGGSGVAGGGSSSCTSGNDSYTKLLIHSNTTDGSTTFVDSSIGGGHTADITVVGNTHHDTDQPHFGTTSIATDGAGDRLSVATSADWNFAAANFTIDFWIRFTELKTACLVNASSSKTFEMTATNISFYDNATTYINAAHGFSINLWYHIALVRYGTTMKIFKNGTLLISVAVLDHTFDWSGALNIGDYSTGAQCINGYFDEIRVSEGIARWTTDFGQPTLPYCD